MNKKIILSLALVLILNLFLFTYSLDNRSEYVGTLSEEDSGNFTMSITGSNYEWGVTHYLLVQKNWYDDGIFNQKFFMFWNFDSIEFEHMPLEVYTSYPPGAQIPIHIIAKTFSIEPSLELIHIVNLAHHLLLGLITSIFIFTVLLRHYNLDHISSSLFSLLPLFPIYFLDGPQFFYQNGFVPDTIILPFFVLVLLLEFLRSSLSNKYKFSIDISLFILIFWGVFTDWLFAFLAFFIILKRVFLEENKLLIKLYEGSKILMPLILSMGTHVFLLLLNGGFEVIQTALRRALYRMGFVTENLNPLFLETMVVERFNYTFWIEHLGSSMGLYLALLTLILILFSLVIFSFQLKRNREDIVAQISLVAILSCLAQIYFWKNHSYEQAFSVLKIVLIFAIVLLVFLPIALNNLLSEIMNKKFKFWVLALALLLVVGSYSLITYEKKNEFFLTPSNDIQEIGEFIHTHTTYNDIVFSPNYEIPLFPLTRLSQSEKIVFPLDNDLVDQKKLILMGRDYSIVLFSIGELNMTTLSQYGNYTLTKQDNLYLYRFE